MNTNEELKTRPEHDCEFFLTTDVCVHSCECENITVSDSSLSVEYVPLKKYQVLQSENSEITLSLQVANQGLDILYVENEELKSENQKLREQLKVGVKIAELMIKYCNERNDGNTALIVEANLKSLKSLDLETIKQ